MSIRPIDMQVMLPRVQKINQAKPAVVNKQVNEQQMMQANTNVTVEKKLNRVNTFERKDHPRVKNEEKRQSRGGNQSGKKKKESKKDERQHLDIKI